MVIAKRTIPRTDDQRERDRWRLTQDDDNNDKANRVPGTDEGNVWVSSGADGDLKDSGINIDDVVTRDQSQVVVTSDYQILEGDEIVYVDCSSGSITVTLPPIADIDDRAYIVEKIDSTTFEAIITGPGSETINGDPSFSLLLQYESVEPRKTSLALTGSNWLI